MCIFFTFQHSWTVNFYISHLPLKGKAMATKPRKRIPLRVALLATIIGLICTLSLFGETSQAASSMEAETCEGKGCIECDPSIKQCVPPTPPAPTPEPSTPAPTPSVTPEPPASTPSPEPPAPTPNPEPPAPTPEPSPEPSTPAPTPSVMPEPPAPTPNPEPSTPTPSPEPSTPVPTPSVTPEPTPPAPTPSVTPEPPAPTPTPEPPAPTPTPEPPASTPSPEPSPSTTPALGLAKTGASSANLPWITLVLSALGWGAWNKAQQRRV